MGMVVEFSDLKYNNLVICYADLNLIFSLPLAKQTTNQTNKHMFQLFVKINGKSKILSIIITSKC